MKKKLLLLVTILTLTQVSAQIQYSSTGTNSIQPRATIDKLSGPRIGMTIITNGCISEKLNSNVTSQFGYQFEKQIAGDDKVAGLIEGIVMIGGLEKGLFLPSLSGMFGLRTASGFELAVGPNLSLSGAALVFGIGKTITMGSLNIPINIAYVPSVNRSEEGYFGGGSYDSNGVWSDGDWNEIENETGHRFTLTVGFNFRK